MQFVPDSSNYWLLISLMLVAAVFISNVRPDEDGDKDADKKGDKKGEGKGKDDEKEEGAEQGAKDAKATTGGAPPADAPEDEGEGSESPAEDESSERADYDLGLSANSFFVAIMALLAVKISITMQAQ